MSVLFRRVLSFSALILVAGGCKSKEDKVNAVCNSMHAEDIAKCGSDKACAAAADDTLAACRQLAKTVGKTDGASNSLADQARDVGSQCGAGDHQACVTYGAALMLGKGVAKDEAKGFALVTKECDAGVGDGCAMVARAYERGMGVAADPAKKSEYMEKACTAGSGEGCRSFALTLAHEDPKRIPPLQKACELKDALGCLGLGGAYLNGGQGVDKDLVKAKLYLQTACDLDPQKMDQACEKAKSITASPAAPSPPTASPTKTSAPSKRPAVVAQAATVQGSLDKDVIRRVMRSGTAKVQHCYEQRLLANPHLAGTVTIRFVIGANGSVSSATGAGLDSTVASCVVGVVRNMTFPAPRGGSVQVSYPFAFQPG